jgi:hypothetical protein
MATDPRYYSTYYAIDGINYRPHDLSSALETLDAAYIPLVLLEAAGIPLDPSFKEQKRIMLRCNGTFYACRKGTEARRFNRLLIDAGMIKGLPLEPTLRSPGVSQLLPTFSHSHCATASGEHVASLPAARKLASRIVAMSILPSSGCSAARNAWSSACSGASSTIAS